VLAQQIHKLIQPFVEKQTIVQRDLKEIESSIDDFIIIKNNENLVACCGVRKHNNINELYCLAVDEKYHGQGYSSKILQKVEQKTTGDLLALSKYQGQWFLKNGFQEMTVKDLPKTIKYNKNRNSKIFIKQR
jgi:N-acetylglutamate synthase-like GNAT family acetyltransferase